jgi:hypothetical protein
MLLFFLVVGMIDVVVFWLAAWYQRNTTQTTHVEIAFIRF